MNLEDSSAYRMILRKGRIAESRALLLRLGTKKFGPPNQAVVQTLDRLEEVERLESLTERVLDANGWDELLAHL